MKATKTAELLLSPKYSNPYPSNARCFWKLQVTIMDIQEYCKHMYLSYTTRQFYNKYRYEFVQDLNSTYQANI